MKRISAREQKKDTCHRTAERETSTRKGKKYLLEKWKEYLLEKR
jgi:hypothetical protein